MKYKDVEVMIKKILYYNFTRDVQTQEAYHRIMAELGIEIL